MKNFRENLHWWMHVVVSIILIAVLVTMLQYVSTPTPNIAKQGVYIGHPTNIKVSLIEYECYQYIKKCEGLLLKKQNNFIGYGHYDFTGQLDSVTEEQADSILDADMSECIQIIEGYYPNQPFNKTIALAMLLYNIGIGSFTKKGMHKSVNKDVWLSFCHYKGKVHKGLLERRRFELRVYSRIL